VKPYPWVDEFPGSITVSDENGIILNMNNKSVEVFAEDGGLALIGSSVLNCHPEPARTKLVELYKTENSNIYTLEKNGKKKLIYQTPWYNEGKFAGYVELALDIPFKLPHFIRD